MSLLWAEERREAAVIPIKGVESEGDEALMAALKERNHQALAELFRRHSRLVFSMGFRILEDSGETEEIVQDVFCTFTRERSSSTILKRSIRLIAAVPTIALRASGVKYPPRILAFY